MDRIRYVRTYRIRYVRTYRIRYVRTYRPNTLRTYVPPVPGFGDRIRTGGTLLQHGPNTYGRYIAPTDGKNHLDKENTLNHRSLVLFFFLDCSPSLPISYNIFCIYAVSFSNHLICYFASDMFELANLRYK